ncbi:MAG: GNAT family N-acetyltransferase [Oscillospiraceae bacterium]|nr:GNAT family N-acetyltransferase [Oscillospiraceae bacterium]
MIIRRADCENDISAAAEIYAEIHTEEEAGRAVTGWSRAIYPRERDARLSFEKGELFVMETEEGIVASARINREQVDVYARARWSVDAPDGEVMVLHTLTVSPRCSGRGYASEFVKFYEDYAMENGCRYLRIDTNERNLKARRLYKRLGYTEADIVPCEFNGISGVNLVCLEKTL